MAVAGAIVGAAAGGWMNDKFGSRSLVLAPGVEGILALAQFILMYSLPESPLWPYKKKKIEGLRLSVEAEIADEASSGEVNILIRSEN
ncbi:Fibroblast growth factor 3 [Asimina triloba]